MTKSKFEFADGRRIDVESIYGGPQLIHGSMRDTLQIEIDPANINFNSLKALFSDKSNLETISSVSITEMDGEDPVEEVTKIGEGYTILVSISDENRSISATPGTWASPETKEVYVVTISQETYAEHQLRISQSVDV